MTKPLNYRIRTFDSRYRYYTSAGSARRAAKRFRATAEMLVGASGWCYLDPPPPRCRADSPGR